MDNIKRSDYSVPFPEVVHALSFSSFEWECSLLAVAGRKHLTVGTYNYKENDQNLDELCYDEMLRITINSRVTDISWSMETTLHTLPKHAKLATSDSNGCVSVFTSELKGDYCHREFRGHTGSVNSVAFDLTTGEQCASVGDDETCRVWALDKETICFNLGSPGMSVCWHKDEATKLMVGLKNGIIRIYSVQSLQPIISLDCSTSLLLSVDWLERETIFVAAATMTDCCIFDMSLSSHPINVIKNLANGYRRVKWCRSHKDILATTSSPGQPIQIINVTNNQILMAGSAQISNCLSWHQRLPVLAVGGDHAVHFWRMPVTR